MMQMIGHSTLTMLFHPCQTIFTSSANPTDEADTDILPYPNGTFDGRVDGDDSGYTFVSADMGEFDVGDVLAVCTCRRALHRV